MIEIRTPTSADIHRLYERARPVEVEEVSASTGDDYVAIVQDAINRSAEAYAGLYNGVLNSIFGVQPYTILGATASPWLLSTVDANSRALLRMTKPVVEYWLTKWERLENMIDARYEASLRWASWAGFKVSQPIPFGPHGLPFCHIEISR